MSFFDDIKQVKDSKKESPTSFFSSIDTFSEEPIKTPQKSFLSSRQPIVPTMTTSTPPVIQSPSWFDKAVPKVEPIDPQTPPQKGFWNSIGDVYKKVEDSVTKRVIDLGNTTSEIFPGIRAATDSLINGTAEPYKDFVKDFIKQNSAKDLVLKQPDGTYKLNPERLQYVKAFALSFGPGGKGTKIPKGEIFEGKIVDKSTRIEGAITNPIKETPITYQGEKDLSITSLEKLKGRPEDQKLTKTFYSDLAKQGDLKQPERDIINEVLSTYPEGSNIPVKEFADKVKTNLLPLDVHPNPEINFEQVTLPKETRGKVANYDEHIYQSPIKTSAGNTHFSGQGIDDYFGHTRVEDMADNSTRRVIEVQSDLYQKGRLEEDANKLVNRMTEAESIEYNALKEIQEGDGTLTERDAAWEKMKAIRNVAEKRPNTPNKKLAQYSNPTAHFRMVREEIKRAAEDGKTKLQFPTGDTALKIEGLGEQNRWVVLGKKPNGDISSTKLVTNELKVGKEIAEEYGSEWIITDVLGDGKFKAVSKDRFDRGIYNSTTHENTKWESVLDVPETSKETFDISGKVDTNNPIYRFYEKDLGRYLTSKYQAKLVTDKQGVKWYEVDVKPEEAKKPVTAFKKPIFSKQSGPTADIETVKALIFKEIPQDKVKLIFTDKLIKGIAVGEYSSPRDLMKGVLKPIIQLYEEGGKVEVRTAYHEAGHYLFDNFLTKEERRQALDIAKKEISIIDRANYFINKYKGEDVILEEYLMDKYAEQKASEGGFNGPNKTFFEKIDGIIRDIVNIVKEVFQRIKEQVTNKKSQSNSKYKRAGDKSEYDKPLTKEEKIAKAEEAMRQGEAKYATDKSKLYEIVTTSKEDRLLVERGIQELNKIAKKESFLNSLKITLPKELQLQKEALTFEKEALESNPARRLTQYMAKKGEFKGTLPEVTGSGSTFATRGDDIVTELGYNDSESAREAFDKYVEDKKKFEDKVLVYQKEKQDFLKQARAKRDNIITEKKVEIATARTEKHIGEIIGDKQKKEEMIKKAIASEKETQKKLVEQELELNKYQEMVRQAQLSESQKKTLISKFKAVFSPISQTDEVTKKIYLDWEISKLKAKEDGNKTYEEYKDKEDNDLKSIMEYEAGKKTPWIKEAFDSAFTQARREGLGIGYKEDYIPHVYNEKLSQIKDAVVKYMEDQKVDKSIVEEFKKTGEVPEVIALRLKIRPNFQKIRTFPDYATAMKYGLTPKFNTIAEHLAYYKEEMVKALANRKLIDDLILKGKILDSFDAPDTWIEVKLPGRLRRSYYAPKNLADSLNGQFRDEENLSLAQEVHKRLGNLSQLAQSSILTGGVPETTINNFAMGQAIRMLTTGVGEAAKFNISGATSSVKAAYSFIRSNFNDTSIKWFKKNQEYIDLMVENNIPLFKKSSDYDQSYKTWKNLLSAKNRREARLSLRTVVKDIKEIRDPKTLGKAFTDLIDSRAIGLFSDVFNKSFSDKTFSNMMPQMQIQIFKDIYEGAVKDGSTGKEAAEFAAKTVRNEFGIANDLGRTQNVKDVFNSYFFAPRFREGMVNIFVNGAKAWTTEFKNPTFARSRSLIIGMIVTYIIYNFLNKQLNNGDNMWENEPGREFALKVPLPSGRIIYTDFMPSSLSFLRNMSSGALATLRGDSKTATQKFGTLFSIPIKLATEIVGNKDYFGRPIYEVTDTVPDKIKKASEHLGLGIAHPYIRELARYFEGKQDIYQTVSMMMELPIKFSTEEKSIIARQYEEKIKKADLNKRERNKIADTIETYDNVQKLKAEGNIGAIETIINSLSDEDYKEYQVVMKYDQIQALKKAKQNAETKALGDSLTDKEYLQYQAIKTIRTTQKSKNTRQSKVDTQKKPTFDSNTTIDDRTLLESVKVYATAIGSDPVTAFNRIFTGQRIRRTDNGAIIVERLPLFKSAIIKKERGATDDLRLDHTLPLTLGGSNDESNLKLVPVEEWKSYTPVEVHLGKLLRSNQISKEEAQRMIIEFKEGKLKAEDILKL